MTPALRRAAAHVVVDSLETPALSAQDEHHLLRVLRIRPSDEVTVTDGAGRWAPAVVDGGAVTLTGPVETVTEAVVAPDEILTIGCAIPKGDRPEWIVQKLTEIGVDRVVFFESARSVVHWNDRKRDAQLVRLRRVAREAVMQCRRVVVPEVDVLTWGDALALGAVALAEPGGPPLASAMFDAESTLRVRSVLIGPEGGFSADEVAACPTRVGLASAILRVETAAIVAATLLTVRR